MKIPSSCFLDTASRVPDHVQQRLKQTGFGLARSRKSLRFLVMFQPFLTLFVLSLNKHSSPPLTTSLFSSSCNCVLFSHHGDIKPKDRLHGRVEQSNLTKRTGCCSAAGCGRRSSSSSEAFNEPTEKKIYIYPVKPRSEPDNIASASAAEETKTALSH